MNQLYILVYVYELKGLKSYLDVFANDEKRRVGEEWLELQQATKWLERSSSFGQLYGWRSLT